MDWWLCGWRAVLRESSFFMAWVGGLFRIWVAVLFAGLA